MKRFPFNKQELEKVQKRIIVNAEKFSKTMSDEDRKLYSKMVDRTLICKLSESLENRKPVAA